MKLTQEVLYTRDRDVVSVTGKASSFALAIHHLIDGVFLFLRNRTLKAKDIHYGTRDDNHRLLLLCYLCYFFLVHDFHLKPWKLSVLLCRLSSVGQK